VKYKLRVTKEDGSIDFREVEANSFQEAKDIMMGEPDVIDAAPAKMVGSSNGSQPSGSGMQDTIDQFVGTEQDVSDIIGF